MSKLEYPIPNYKYIVIAAYTPNIAVTIHGAELAEIGKARLRAALDDLGGRNSHSDSRRVDRWLGYSSGRWYSA